MKDLAKPNVGKHIHVPLVCLCLLGMLLYSNFTAAQAITSLNPTCAIQGQSFQLTITGSGFDTGNNGSVVKINNDEKNHIAPTTKTTTQLILTVPANMVTGNVISIAVGNRLQGGYVYSNTLTLDVIAPLAITNIKTVYYTGDAATTLVGSHGGGTFTLNGATLANGVFTPGCVGVGTHTIRYTYTTAKGCSNFKEYTITVKGYSVVVTADPYPICRGANIKYTALVYRDATVIYPYIANEFGQPIDKITKAVLSDTSIPEVNMAYFTTAGINPNTIPSIIVSNAWRFYQPIVQGGVLVNKSDIDSDSPGLFDYKWTKNNSVPNNGIGGNRPNFGQAGLSSTDWYAVQVTPKAGTNCPTTSSILSQRMYWSEPDGYTITINPFNGWCNSPSGVAGDVTITAQLGNLPGGWETANLTYRWYRRRNNLSTPLSGLISYSGGTSVSITLPKSTFQNGDEVYIDFDTKYDNDIRLYSACKETSESLPVKITVTSPLDVSGDLIISWLNNMTQWKVEAQSALAGTPGLEYEWYIGSGQTARALTTSTNTIIIDNPTIDLYVKCIIKAPNGVCISDVEMDNARINPMPVEIIYLTAQKQGYDVVLEWATAMEEDNAGFEIQVSQDGLDYRKLDYVATKNGNSSQRQVYKYTDKENGKHGTRYYRLKQMDLNGQFEFFGPKVVEFGSVSNRITVYPNPFVNKLELNVEAEQDGPMVIILSNSVGKQLVQKTVMIGKGVNTEQLILEPGLPQGVYFVTTRMGSVTNHFKVLKR